MKYVVLFFDFLCDMSYDCRIGKVCHNNFVTSNDFLGLDKFRDSLMSGDFLVLNLV